MPHGLNRSSTLGLSAPASRLEAPGLPTDLERHPEGVEALAGYVWLDTGGKVLHVEASRLEFRESPPA